VSFRAQDANEILGCVNKLLIRSPGLQSSVPPSNVGPLHRAAGFDEESDWGRLTGSCEAKNRGWIRLSELARLPPVLSRKRQAGILFRDARAADRLAVESGRALLGHGMLDENGRGEAIASPRFTGSRRGP
jgi:hypothetical protein